MKNYISINGQKIELTDNQVKEIQQSFGISNIKLCDIAEGETFKLEKYEFIVLEQSGDTTAVILKGSLCDNEVFGENNNYKDSNVDEICNKFFVYIAEIIGIENLIEHKVDLTADDGLKDYGTIRRKMSLLTANLYRRYVEILDKYKIEKWWWLATAYSTPKHENSSWVKCVSPCGYVSSNDFGSDYGLGVRPFCILNSNIFVSK